MVRWVPIPIRTRDGLVTVDLVPDPWMAVRKAMLTALRDDFTALLATRTLRVPGDES